MYYLAGSYDPAGLTLNFQPGVTLQQDSDQAAVIVQHKTVN